MPRRLNPGIACSPGMPIDAFALPMPAQSLGIVWNFTSVKPTSNSFRKLEPSVRLQLPASPRKGASLVDAK